MSVVFGVGGGQQRKAEITLERSDFYRLENIQNKYENGLLWPNSRGDGLVSSAITWGRINSGFGGGQQQKKIIGITRDQGGAVLGNCTVHGFVTEKDVFVGQMVSDSGGYFEFCSQYPATNHYLVAYKAGSPDIAGTTVNTLQAI